MFRYMATQSITTMKRFTINTHSNEGIDKLGRVAYRILFGGWVGGKTLYVYTHAHLA